MNRLFRINGGQPLRGSTWRCSAIPGFAITLTLSLVASAPVAAADLAVRTTAAPEPVFLGGNLTYTVVVSNRGPASVPGVVLTNTLSSRTMFLSATASQGSCTHSGGDVRCDLGVLNAQAAATVTLVTRAASVGTITNISRVGASEPENNPADNAATHVSAVVVSQPPQTNPEPIQLPDFDPGPASPFPSTIFIAGVTASVYKVTVTLHGFTHIYPDDVDLLLVGPQGQSVLLMSDCGINFSFTNISLTFDDDAAQPLPNSAAILPGSYRPANYDNDELFADPAPPPPYGNALSVFKGTNPNGEWALYLADDLPEDPGEIAQGWSLQIVTADPIADLNLTVTDTPDPVFVSSNLTYRIGVTNRGPAVASGVRVIDTLPPGVNFVSATATAGACVHEAGIVTCHLGNLNRFAGAAATIVVSPAFAGAKTNFVTVASTGSLDLNPNDNAVSTTTFVQGLADLAVSAVPGTAPVVAGGLMTFELVVTNAGPGAATSVRLTNLLAPQTVFVSAVSKSGACAHQDGTVICDFGDLAFSTQAVATLTLRTLQAGPVTNRFSVGGAELDPSLANNAVTLETSVQPGANLTLRASVQPQPATLGQPIALSLVISNAGPDSTATVLTNTLPSGFAFTEAVSDRGSCVHLNGQVVCELGTLAGGQASSVLISGIPNVTGTLTNRATVRGDLADPEPAGNTLAHTIVVSRTADLALGAMVSAPRYELGGILNFFVRVTNRGPDLATGIRLTNRFSAPVRVIAADVPSGSCSAVDGVVICDVPALSRGAAAEVALGVEPVATGPLTLSSEARGSEMDLNPANNTAAAATLVLNRSGHFANTNVIQIGPSGAAGPYPSVLVVSNHHASVDKVTVTLTRFSHTAPDDVDILLVSPAGRASLLLSDSGSSVAVSNLTFVFDGDATSVQPDNSALAPGIYRPTNPEPGSDVFPAPAPAGPFAADLSALEGADPNGTWSLFVFNDSNGSTGRLAGWSITFASATPVADLTLLARAQPYPAELGTNLTVILTATNRGPSAATAVLLTNRLPAGATLLAATPAAGSCDVAGGEVRCDLGALPVKGSVAVILQFRVDALPALTNHAAVAAAQPDSDLADNAVTLEIPVRVPTPRLGLPRLAAGALIFEFFGVPSQEYRVRGSTNLVHWTELGTAVHLGGGQFQFIDPVPLTFPTRFYQVLAP